jgi:hypothetical protein
MSGDAMRLMSTLFCAVGLLCGCSSGGTTYDSSVSYVYDDWLYQHHDWYDDDFWIWVDDHPECCDDEDDIEEALQNWYDDLDPDQQQAVRDRAQTWMDQHGVVPAAGQSSKDLVLETASTSRLTSDQEAALSERAADLSPEQRAALRESAQGMSFDRVSDRSAAGGFHRSISNHPTPARAGLSGGTRFHAARGGGRGGRGRGR